jgi:ATP-binding cassette subfamily B protein
MNKWWITSRFRLSAPYQRLVEYFLPHWPLLVLGGVCVLLTNLIKLAAPWILRLAIDDLSSAVTHTKLLYQAEGLVLIALALGSVLFFQRRIFASVARSVEYHLRNDFYAHLQKLPSLDCQQQYRTGDLMARGTNDIAAIRAFGDSALSSVIDIFFVVLLVIPVMLAINWRLTLLSLLLLPLVAVTTKLFAKRIHDGALKVQEHFGLVSNRAQESLAGVRVVRAFVRERAERDSFTQANRALVQHNLQLIRFSALLSPILQFLIGLAFIAVFWYGGYLIIHKLITIGQYVQFKIYLGYVVVPVVTFGWVINLLQRSRASMSRLHSVLSIEPTICDTEETRDINRIVGEIEFRHLTFTYKGTTQPALEDINLRIAPGQTVVFVGTVGAGKSTLLNLVSRLLEAAPGQVLVDGHPINRIPLRTLRAAIGYVPQETFLFSDSLEDNIAFGVKEPSQEKEIEGAALKADLADDIDSFPEKFRTLVGERGIMLSGGQKQRTAIARAIIGKPQILLLDDALSAVDTYTERKILTHLRRTMRGCTSLVVSHRVATLKEADLIVVLEDHRIAEQGTHVELMARSGLYSALCAKQILEEELATNYETISLAGPVPSENAWQTTPQPTGTGTSR